MRLWLVTIKNKGVVSFCCVLEISLNIIYLLCIKRAGTLDWIWKPQIAIIIIIIIFKNQIQNHLAM